MKTQKIYGNCKKLQMVMARGLVSPWKQPIFYDFDYKFVVLLLLTSCLTCLILGNFFHVSFFLPPIASLKIYAIPPQATPASCTIPSYGV